MAAARWSVLLIGGPSCVGKTTAARTLAARLGIAWLMVDDVRLALIRSQVTLPRNTEALYFFEHARFRHLPADSIRDGLISLGQVMAPAIEVVIENHVDQHEPVILEGDSIHPSLLARAPIQGRAAPGHVRAVFIVEPEEAAMHANVLARARGLSDWAAEEIQRDARAKWLYGQWLTQEARRYALPVVAPRPWDTLLDRLIAASTIAADT